MKELKAYIRERRLNEVVRALRNEGATAVTVVKTVPMGADVEPEYLDVSRAVSYSLLGGAPAPDSDWNGQVQISRITDGGASGGVAERCVCGCLASL